MRYVVSVTINGQERVRTAVHADNIAEAMRTEAFTEAEMLIVEQADPDARITVHVEEQTS